MADLLGQADDIRQLRLGDIRRGIIKGRSSEALVVEIGSKQMGIVPQDDLDKLPPAEVETLTKGQEVLVYVTALEGDGAEPMQLSIYLAKREADWLKVGELLDTGSTWKGRVTGYNKGGLIVPFGHIRGFVPASQVTGITRTLPKEKKLARLSQLVGKELPLKVIEADRRQRRLVFSERQGQQADKTRTQEQAFEQLRKGEIRRGRVQALTEYGAFVDLGDIVGLVHRTELAYFRVEHPCEILTKGQEIDVQILRVNRKRNRLSLSLKRTYKDPWQMVTERYELRQLVEGRVIRHTGAGIFVFLSDGVLGLISRTDLRKSQCTEEDVGIGQQILARVARIDGARRRLGLSLQRVRDDEWKAWQQRQERVEENQEGEDLPAPEEN
jgi:small subunit ribosomal protein S1